MKKFNEIKGKVHDASGINNPSEWLWSETNGIYYPVENIRSVNVNIIQKEQKRYLENSIEHFELDGVKVFQRIIQDKRVTKAKFFLQIESKMISPALDYYKMNSFIQGMGAHKQNFEK